MSNLGSSLGTTQPFIPVVPGTQIGRYAGLHMHFPALTDSIGSTGLYEAVVAERSNIILNAPIWATGQVFSVATEPADVSRIWTVGGSAAASHARMVCLRSGLWITLPGDLNKVIASSGAPGSGAGSDGDVAVDYANNSYYLKTAGAWSAAAAIYSGGTGSTTLTSPGTGLPAVAALGVDSNGATSAKLANQTAALATLKGAAGIQGQISAPTDAPGIVRHTGVAGAAHHLSPTGTIIAFDTTAQLTGTFAATVDANCQFVHVKFAPTSAVAVTLTLPAAPAQYGQEIGFACDYSNNVGAGLTVNNSAGQSVGYADTSLAMTVKWMKNGTAAAGWVLISLMQVGGNSLGLYAGPAMAVALGGGIVVDPVGGIAIGLGASAGLAATADGTQIAIGNNAFTASSQGISIGPNSGVNKSAGMAIGAGTQSNGLNALAVGLGGNAARDNSSVFGGNGISTESISEHCRALGSGLIREFYLQKFGVTTTTAVELSADGAAAAGARSSATGNRWYVPQASGTRSLYLVTLTICGYISGSTAKAFIARKAVNVFVTSPGAISLIGSPVDIVASVVAGVTAPTITIAADDTNKALTVTAQIANTTDGTWNFKVYGTCLSG